MRVCFQIDHATDAVTGVWWEVGEYDVACGYLNPLSMVAMIGTMEMLAKSPFITWWEHWDRLSDRISLATWWEVVEVDDESYETELLYDLASCHPRDVDRDQSPITWETKNPMACEWDEELASWLMNGGIGHLNERGHVIHDGRDDRRGDRLDELGDVEPVVLRRPPKAWTECTDKKNEAEFTTAFVRRVLDPSFDENEEVLPRTSGSDGEGPT